MLLLLAELCAMLGLRLKNSVDFYKVRLLDPGGNGFGTSDQSINQFCTSFGVAEFLFG